MASPGERPDIESKIEHIGDRIVRGRLAKGNAAVKWYRLYRATTIAASALTSIGLTNPLITLLGDKGSEVTVAQAFGTWSGLPMVFSFLGVFAFVVAAVAFAFYRQEKIEERAIQSLGLSEAMQRLEVEFLTSLEQQDPMEPLLGVYERVCALENTHFQAMPPRAEARTDVKTYVQSVVSEYCKNWTSIRPAFERREKIHV